MKRLFALLAVTVAMVGMAGISNAALYMIGTATYGENDYRLVYEDTQHLVWLDYTRDVSNWYKSTSWASGLGGSLAVTLNPGFITSIDWSTGWRLPGAGSNPESGYNQITSEMGHLYYVSLRKPAGGPSGDVSPFEHLVADYYWSGTESSPATAWCFGFKYGDQFGGYQKSTAVLYGLAVHQGEVSAVAIPAAIWLLSSGLVGLLALRRREENVAGFK